MLGVQPSITDANLIIDLHPSVDSNPNLAPGVTSIP
jgi:hypothetical protein